MKNNTVYLVGAGIGSADMITLRGLNCIRNADCIIYDRLVDMALLDEAPAECEKIYVGKSAGAHYMKQDEINSLLLSKAKLGGIVVRLKGGDPYVFGRGGEEALFLKEAGIDFQVVPGVTSAIAGACFAGIPVTHRDTARSVHIITAHTSGGGLSDEEFARYANIDGTLVFLMGLSQLGSIAKGLTDNGMDHARPCAVISQAGAPEQRTVASTLENIVEAAEKAALVSPAIIIVGDTVGLRAELNFFEARPLFGKKILVTRANEGSEKLCSELISAGAAVTVSPMINMNPITGALDSIWDGIESYTHIVFSSGNAVKIFMDSMYAHRKDARCLHAAKLCTVGRATADRLSEYGLTADVVPERFSSEGLLDKLETELYANDRVLLLRAAISGSVLKDGIEQLCKVDAVDIYNTLLPEDTMTAERFIDINFDAVVFSSSSAAVNFDKTIGLSKLSEYNIRVFSIGPSTSETLRKYGADPIESRQATFAALAEKIIEYYEEDRK